MIVRNMTECQLVEKTSEESVKMVSADLASAKNKRESRIACSCVSITLLPAHRKRESQQDVSGYTNSYSTTL